MSLLKTTCIREIAGRPIARRNFIENLSIYGEESFHQSSISVGDMLPPILFNNLNEEDINCHFQKVLYSAMEDLICLFPTHANKRFGLLFSNPREQELVDFLFDLSFEVESRLKHIKPGDIYSLV